ncbi:hypothetical protein BZA77DRAFT_344462 [Pyronema omphalodes]|nr:hypothetical protein BZA77DRAFT_344462 [Pyronema omphalodes]
MQFFTPLIALFSLTVVVAAQSENNVTSSGCIVPQVILYDLPNEFALQLYTAETQNQGVLSYKQRNDQYIPGLFGGGGEIINSTLSEGTLKLDNGAVGYIVEPRGRPRFMRIQFMNTPNEAARFEAYYRCYNDRAQLVVRPNSDTGLTFCLFPEAQNRRDVRLWVKPKSDESTDCVAVTAAVTDGVRPF